jgi:hypothetical protein
MASPAYTTDLTTINTSETGQTVFTEGGTGWADGSGLTQPDADNFIQGAAASSQILKTGIGSFVAAIGSNITIPTDGAVLAWVYNIAPAAVNTLAQGGFRIMLGSSASAYYGWAVGGRDYYVYGGWICAAATPTYGGSFATDYTLGSPASQTSFGYVGVACNMSGSLSRGQSFWVDTIRYGRCEVRVSGGDSGGYATAVGAAAQNDSTTNRWGLFQAIEGGYKAQGLLRFGTTPVATTNRARSGTTVTLTFSSHTMRAGDVILVSTVGGTGYNGTWTITSVTATTVVYTCATNATEGTTADTNGRVGAVADFRDANRSVVFAHQPRVTANFNTIEVCNAGSRVDMSAFGFQNLGTVSRGRWVTTDDATINLTSCTFTGLGTLSFKSLSTILTTTFRDCDLVTQGNATFTGCTFDKARSSSAILSDNPTKITNCSFTSDGTGHGIEINTAGTYDFTGNTFIGYSTTSPGSNPTANTGSTDAMVYNNSGGAVTINLLSGTNITVRNGAGATTTVVSGNKTVTITGLKNPSEVRVFDQGTTTERSGTGAESVTSGSHSFTLPSGTAVDIAILSLGYQNLRILNFSTSSDTSIPISQVLDRQYLNP